MDGLDWIGLIGLDWIGWDGKGWDGGRDGWMDR